MIGKNSKQNMTKPKAKPMMSSPRPKPAGPAREVLKNQMALDRAAKLGDAGHKPTMGKSKMAKSKMGYKDGGMCAPKKGKK